MRVAIKYKVISFLQGILGFCSFSRHGIYHLIFKNYLKKLMTETLESIKIFTMWKNYAYRAPFARASAAGCDLPHSVYNSDALLKKSATSFQLPSSFAEEAADSICLAASQGLLDW